jgi:hypothetical protein
VEAHSEAQLEVQLEAQMKFKKEILKSLISQKLSEMELVELEDVQMPVVLEEMLNTQKLSIFMNHQKKNHALMQDQLKLKQRNTTKSSSLRHQVTQEQLVELKHAHK